jgi:hypothetical protein
VEAYNDGEHKRFPAHENVVTFEVSEVGYLLDDRAGIITPLLHWEVRPEDGESQEGGDRRGDGGGDPHDAMRSHMLRGRQ